MKYGVWKGGRALTSFEEHRRIRTENEIMLARLKVERFMSEYRIKEFNTHCSEQLKMGTWEQ